MLRRSITAALTDSLPVPPLVSLIVEYGIMDGCMYGKPHHISCAESRTGSNHVLCVVCCVFFLVTAVTLVGTDRGFANGDLKSAALNHPYSICSDPTNPESGLFIGDYTSIRYFNGKTLELVAGHQNEGCRDGIGDQARFSGIEGLVCFHATTKSMLIACELSNCVLRLIDVSQRAVTLLAGDRSVASRNGFGRDCGLYCPRKIVFDRSPTAKPNTVLYITEWGAIRRFDVNTTHLTTIKLVDPPTNFNAYGIDFARSGCLIVTCVSTHSVYAVNPITGAVSLIAGTGSGGAGDNEFAFPCAVAVVEIEHSVYCIDQLNNRIRRISLPQQLFA